MHSLIKQSESVIVQKTHFSIVFVYDLLYILINTKLYQAFVKQLHIITNKEYTFPVLQIKSVLGVCRPTLFYKRSKERGSNAHSP